MSRPYDLLAFLNQDTRWDNIKLLYHDLKARKDVIQKLWNELERETDVHAHLTMDTNCLNAGSLGPFNWYTQVYDDSTSRIGSLDYFTVPEIKPVKVVDVPDCKKISSLTFSMHTFEHLEVRFTFINLYLLNEFNLINNVPNKKVPKSLK